MNIAILLSNFFNSVSSMDSTQRRRQWSKGLKVFGKLFVFLIYHVVKSKNDSLSAADSSRLPLVVFKFA